MEAVGIIALGAVLAGFVQGLSGFGFGLTALSIWAWALEPDLAAVLAVFGGLVGQIIAAFSLRRGFDWRILLPFVLGGLAGIPLGVWLLPALDIVLFKAALGVFLVLWCPAMLFVRDLPRIRFGGRIADAVIGAIGGVMGGLGGFTGAVPTLWCTLRGMDKETQRAVIQNFNLSMLAVTMAAYVGTGLAQIAALPLYGLVALAVTIPVLIGTRLYTGLSEARFRQIVLTLLTLAGLALLASALPQLIARL
jgi:uncharacterized membrane protein YfcA